ncbi:MAG: polysaccharide deacetylase family protein [Elusimicrobiota bacterium]
MKRIILSLFIGLAAGSIGFCIEPGSFYADGPKTAKAVALTFDDGPDVSTPKVLEILKKHGVKATFFMQGSYMERRPAAAKAVMPEGHEIGSHLYSHPDFYHSHKDDFREFWTKEAEKTENSFQKALGFKPVLMRMPHGYVKPWVKEEAKKRGYILINWSCGYDWHKMTADEMLAEYVKCIKPGAIFLMHDGGRDRKRTLELLPKLIEELKKRGYKMVTVSELLGIK